MEEKMYLVSRSDLLEMIEAQMRLAALESGGVDNWEWYGESLGDFLREDFEENKEEYIKFFNLKDEEEIEEFKLDFEFSAMAQYIITGYDEVKE